MIGVMMHHRMRLGIVKFDVHNFHVNCNALLDYSTLLNIYLSCIQTCVNIIGYLDLEHNPFRSIRID